MLVVMQDNCVMFKGDGCDDEVGCGQGQACSAKGESELIQTFPCGLGDGEHIEALQFDSQVVPLSLCSATLEEFQDHDGAGGRESRRDTIPEKLFELRMAGVPEAGNPRGGIDQDAVSRHGASS